ncbi:hypothetical protein L916_08594 [Phytophthora nicotianae]|nr:hypothetical protein L916_08594 [Phytophthora nicotianae]
MVYLASGGSMDNAATLLGMSKSSAVVYINQVLSVLSKMAKQKITLPSTSAEIKRVSLGFEKIAGFPDVIGAIDGSLIRISDAGYKIFRHLLTPFDEAAAAHCPKKKRYNYKLSQTRITVERAFGILKNRLESS